MEVLVAGVVGALIGVVLQYNFNLVEMVMSDKKDEE